MIQRPIRSILSLLGGIALLAGTACTPTESYWSEAQAVKQNKVEPIRLVHDVKFASGNQISSAEQAQLNAFFTRHQIGYGDKVYVLRETTGSGALAGQRTETVLRNVRAQGAEAFDLPSLEAQPGLVRIVVNRYVVIPPNCPDWTKSPTADYGNTPMSNLGCANTANFGLMVADPSELVQGRQGGTADATAGAAAIQRYRTDKVKPLDKAATDTGSGQ